MSKHFILLFCSMALWGCSAKDPLTAYHPLSASELTEDENFELCSDSAYSLCSQQFQLKSISTLIVDAKQAPAPTLTIDLDSDRISGYAHPYHYTAMLIKDGRKVHFKSIEFHKAKGLAPYSVAGEFQKVIEQTRSYNLEENILRLYNSSGKELAEFKSKTPTQLEYEWDGYCNALQEEAEHIVEQFQDGLSLKQAQSSINTTYKVNEIFTRSIFQKISTKSFGQWDEIPEELLEECKTDNLPQKIEDIPKFDRDKNMLLSKLLK